jgi:predicted HicB family RNase H-like nuclease
MIWNMTTTVKSVGYNAPKYLLRMPPELNDRVRRIADEQDMSINTTILMLLAGSVGFQFESEAP